LRGRVFDLGQGGFGSARFLAERDQGIIQLLEIRFRHGRSFTGIQRAGQKNREEYERQRSHTNQQAITTEMICRAKFARLE
jgi:hypothetical protein